MHFIGFILFAIIAVAFWLSRHNDANVKLEAVGLVALVIVMIALGASGMQVKKKQRAAMPEPLGIIMSRMQEVERLPAVYRVPVWNDTDKARQREAALLHAEVNASDPFAFGRMVLHLERGLDRSDDVATDAKSKLRVRDHARRIYGGSSIKRVDQ